jgi:hypothetical protein
MVLAPAIRTHARLALGRFGHRGDNRCTTAEVVDFRRRWVRDAPLFAVAAGLCGLPFGPPREGRLSGSQAFGFLVQRVPGASGLMWLRPPGLVLERLSGFAPGATR